MLNDKDTPIQRQREKGRHFEFGFLCCLSTPGLSKDMRHRKILSEVLCCLTMCGLSRERERERERE